MKQSQKQLLSQLVTIAPLSKESQDLCNYSDPNDLTNDQNPQENSPRPSISQEYGFYDALEYAQSSIDQNTHNN